MMASSTEERGAAPVDRPRWTCLKCGVLFTSGTKLHLHLVDTGHAVDRSLLPDAGPPPAPPANRDFFNYYEAQQICAPSVWAKAYAKFAEPLPRDFRLSMHSHKQAASEMLQLLNAQSGTELAPAATAATVPGTAWRVARRDERTKQLMLAGQDCGLLHRQELVSQLPAALLGIRPEHAVLDMCCAPGSKTLQLLDLMHSGLPYGAVPSGVLVANDANRSRLVTVAQRSRRQPRSPLLLIATDARRIPCLKKPRGYKLKYDRILADVPCSGDGTFRKKRGLWTSWGPHDGLGLHTVQVGILKRGIQLLAAGGRLLYSTCSLNPIEDEAVVAAALRSFGPDVVKICPIAGGPEARSWGCTGLTAWKVPDRTSYRKRLDEKEKEDEDTNLGEDGCSQRRWFDSFDAVPAADRADWQDPVTGQWHKGKGVIRVSMFPPSAKPTGGAMANAESVGESEAWVAEQLKHCVRCLPTDFDSGGFFLALFERQPRVGPAQLPSKSAATSPLGRRGIQDSKMTPSAEPAPESDFTFEPAAQEHIQQGSARVPRCSKRVQPELNFLFRPADQQMVQKFAAFYGLSERFPLDQIFRNAVGQWVLLSPLLAKLQLGGRRVPVIEGGMYLLLDGDPSFVSADFDGSCEGIEAQQSSPQKEHWLLFDEAAELVGRAATKRCLLLSPTNYLALLTTRMASTSMLRKWLPHDAPPLSAGGLVVGVAYEMQVDKVSETVGAGAYHLAGEVLLHDGSLKLLSRNDRMLAAYAEIVRALCTS